MQSPDQDIWKVLANAICGHETALGSFDEMLVMQLADHHGVCPLLDSRIKSGTKSNLAPSALKRLSDASRDEAAHDLLLNKSTQILVSLLATNNISALVLKGTPIAHLYYERTYLRPRCDTDLYIKEQDVGNVAELLADHNYAVTGLGKRRLSSKQFGAHKAIFQNQKQSFDIHYKLSNRVMFRKTLPFDECFLSNQTVESLGPHARTLSIVDLMLHACIHRIAHGRNTERNRLIWIFDIHLLAGAMNETQFQAFINKAVNKEIGVLCSDALKLSKYLFGTRLPDETQALLTKNATREPSAKLIHSSKLRWVWSDIQMLNGIREKAAFIKELLVSS